MTDMRVPGRPAEQCTATPATDSHTVGVWTLRPCRVTVMPIATELSPREDCA